MRLSVRACHRPRDHPALRGVLERSPLPPAPWRGSPSARLQDPPRAGRRKARQCAGMLCLAHLDVCRARHFTAGGNALPVQPGLLRARPHDPAAGPWRPFHAGHAPAPPKRSPDGPQATVNCPFRDANPHRGASWRMWAAPCHKSPTARPGCHRPRQSRRRHLGVALARASPPRPWPRTLRTRRPLVRARLPA